MIRLNDFISPDNKSSNPKNHSSDKIIWSIVIIFLSSASQQKQNHFVPLSALSWDVY